MNWVGVDISWFYNSKPIKSQPNIKIRIKEGFTSCTVMEVTEEMAGEYMCKAISSIGTHTTKARLHVHGWSSADTL